VLLLQQVEMERLVLQLLVDQTQIIQVVQVLVVQVLGEVQVLGAMVVQIMVGQVLPPAYRVHLLIMAAVGEAKMLAEMAPADLVVVQMVLIVPTQIPVAGLVANNQAVSAMVGRELLS
jgi:hypothetical protein